MCLKIWLESLDVAVAVILKPVVESLDGEAMIKHGNLAYKTQIKVANAALLIVKKQHQ